MRALPCQRWHPGSTSTGSKRESMYPRRSSSTFVEGSGDRAFVSLPFTSMAPNTTRTILLPAGIGCAFMLLLAACGQPTAPNNADLQNQLTIGWSPLFVAPSNLTLTVEAD